MSIYRRPPNGHSESPVDEDTSGGGRALKARTRMLQNMLEEADFEDDTRTSVQVYVGDPKKDPSLTPKANTTTWKKYAGIGFAVGSFIVGVIAGIIANLR